MVEIVSSTALASTLGKSRAAETRLQNALSAVDQANPEGRDEAIWAAAQEFEAVFLSQMLGPVFESIESNEITGGGQGEKMWRGMMVQEYGKQMSEAGGVGIAKHVYNELLRAQEGSV